MVAAYWLFGCDNRPIIIEISIHWIWYFFFWYSDTLTKELVPYLLEWGWATKLELNQLGGVLLLNYSQKKEGGGLTHKFVSLCSKLARNTVIGQMPKTLPEYWFYLKKKNKPLSIKTNCGSERLQNHEKVKAEIIDAWINGWAGEVYFGIIKMVTEFIFRQFDRIMNTHHILSHVILVL